MEKIYEVWAQSNEFPDIEVSSRGNIRRVYFSKMKNDYAIVELSRNHAISGVVTVNCKGKSRTLAKMVYELHNKSGHVSSKHTNPLIHIDGDLENCKSENLITVSELLELAKSKGII